MGVKGFITQINLELKKQFTLAEVVWAEKPVACHAFSLFPALFADLFIVGSIGIDAAPGQGAEPESRTGNGET